jgi:acyl-CoA synthetase (AMP-forming)/AMP-acid ligase II
MSSTQTTPFSDPTEMNLASLLLTHAASRPKHPAIEHDDSIITHAEAADLVKRYAAVLANEGVKPGDRVGLSLLDTPDHLLLHYATAYLGATIVPIDCRWKAAEKTAVSRAFACKVVVTEAGDEAIPNLPALIFDPHWREDQWPFPEIADGGAAPVVLSLSSGTTGRPTGALVSHHQLYERFISQWVGMGFNCTDRYLLATPLYFGGGRSFAMSTLAAGGTVIMRRPPITAEDIMATVQARHVTALFLVPTQIGRMLDTWKGPGLAMPDVRCLVTSGSAMQPGDRQRVIERLTPKLVDYYATSEGGGIAVLLPDEQMTYRDTVGRPAFRVEIQVVNETNEPVPMGEVGRLRYRGPGVSTWLVDGDGKTVASEEGGWFAPGDLAQITETGHVRLVGRIKDVIIRGGVNIYPAEIEAVLSTNPDVLEASVFGVDDPDLGETVAAAVVLRPGASASEEALRLYVKDRLASYKAPQWIVLVDALPRNPSGKVIRAELKPLLAAKT